MMLLKLHRTQSTPQNTLGVLLVPSLRPLVTLELPWKDNLRNVSCVPRGTYELVLHESPKFGRVFLLKNVPSRDNILIHPGNTVRDTEGCILLGLKFGHILGDEAVVSSRQAVNQLFNLLKFVTEDILLQIL